MHIKAAILIFSFDSFVYLRNAVENDSNSGKFSYFYLMISWQIYNACKKSGKGI